MAEMNREELIKKYGPSTALTNGIAIQMYKDAAKLPSITAANWFITWMNSPSLSATDLRSKIYRVAQKASKLRGAALEAYKKELFVLPQPSQTPVPVAAPAPTRQLDTCISSNNTSSPPRPIRAKVSTPKKKLNARQHEIERKERHIAILDRKLTKLKNALDDKNQKMSMYSVKNVKRREERNVSKRTALRNERNKFAAIAKEREKENEHLKVELTLLRDLKKENAKLKRKSVCQDKKLKGLIREKKTLMKRAKYHHKKRLAANEKLENAQSVEQEKDEKCVVETKNAEGEFTDETRFCVVELTGLEVAAGKIGPVMESVAAACGVKFSALPSRSACVKMIDEGQVLAKTYIHQNILKRCSSFGIHKDGTSRRKVKILDTSVNTDEGESFCLGWSSVVSETGKAIADDTKEKLEEVVMDDGRDMLDLLRKLEYYMNDRAANEKKSCNLIDEWREEMLRCDGELLKEVHHLHCAAHVLLGFHTYVLNALKKLDFVPKQEYKHPVAVLLRDASDLFGPVGDYRGLRNQWEAYCLEKKAKSFIKSYKDNRFNGLFEVAAQVFHHHQDFCKVLESLPSKNAKQTRFYQALKDPILLLLIECLGLFFHKVTGPFWTLVISSKISHQRFKQIILHLKHDLQKCKDDPCFFFSHDSFSLLKLSYSSPGTKQHLSSHIKCDKMKALVATISDGLLETILVQLKEVIESSKEVVVKAPLTNLTCERHFGHLDASQRRRPNCSLHHHSSVILLKQTRKRLRAWFESLEAEERAKLWKRARTQGKEMRKKHQDRDRKAIVGSLTLKMRKAHEDVDDGGDLQEDLKEGQMIAVACEDAWYPAMVESIGSCDQGLTVSFAELGKAPGAFRWPTGKDVHTVSRRSVVEANVVFEARAGGRWWLATNGKEIDKKYKKFQ